MEGESIATTKQMGRKIFFLNRLINKQTTLAIHHGFIHKIYAKKKLKIGSTPANT